MKLCSCGQPAYRKGRVQDTLCSGCRKSKSSEWNRKNKDRYRHNQLKRKFGITLEEYNRLLAAQNNGCAICMEPCNSGRALAVDHNHKTNVNRGLLCGNCNRGIGNLKENPLILQRAIEYLARHN